MSTGFPWTGLNERKRSFERRRLQLPKLCTGDGDAFTAPVNVATVVGYLKERALVNHHAALGIV